ncbi:peptidase M16 inactive domain protein [Cooperia oncophora]
MMSRFWRKSEVLMNGTIAVSLYRSTRSRLVVAIGDVPGPLVKGCISFVTETDCDDGLPHTLEHLVFMGSKKYPYKGVLDVIANRCLASGTNAWTDQDHTAYTLSTVGSEGFFKVLPVYLNHLLSPMLSPSQFATEVHHINGKGEDAGVVYSEMQDHESEMSCIMDRRVRDFHKKYYHLSNMMVTVAGRVNHERLLKIIETTEEVQALFSCCDISIYPHLFFKEHLADIPASFQRPFISHQLKPMAESSEHSVVCPSDDESRGSVEISWFGHPPTDFKQKVAFDVLFDYMSNTPVSPLQREFVLIEKPLASQVSFHVTEQTTCLIQLSFSGVPTERLEEVSKKFMEKVVKEHLEDSAWDMERMGFLIGQSVKNELKKMEKHPATQLFGHMIGHQLYDENDDQLKTRMDELELIRRLRSEPASFWSGIVKKYFTSPHVVVLGIPSEKMVEQVAKEEKARLDEQRKKLGKDGIKQCGENIKTAIKENTAKKPSAEVLSELIVKKLEEFDRFPVDLKCNRGGSPSTQPIAKFLDQFPFPATIHNCPTKFVELFLLFDTSVLTLEQRALLDLYTELLFESPAKIDGVVKSAEEVSKLYTRDLVDHSIYIGVSGNFEKLLHLRLVVDAETGFPNLAKWAEIFTTGIIFDVQRVKQCAKKLASDAREKKRDGCAVANSALCTMIYLPIHEKIAKDCDSHPQEVLSRLEEAKAGESLDTACVGRQKVISVGGSESSFIYQSCMMDCDWMSDELVPTMLLTQYLSQCEGPLWRGIRGVGLAYGVNLYVRSDRKTITLSLYRCAQPAQAYEETKKIVV